MPIVRTGRDVEIVPAGPVRATVRPPGSKSLTNRLLACAALADGHSTLTGASFSDDADAMVRGLAVLGVQAVADPARAQLTVHGTRGNFVADDVTIDVGSAGTAMRFLTALACLGHGHRRLDGSPRMRQRPIAELVDGLRELGAPLGYDVVPGFPPLTVMAQGLAGGELHFDTLPSSQFVSALLMVAPYAHRDVLLAIDGTLTSRPYVEMTLAVMQQMGVETLATDGQRFVVPAFQQYRAGTYAVEPDASAATYLWAAAAITGGCVRVPGLSRASRQGDVLFVDVLAAMGCEVREGPDWLEVAAPPNRSLAGISVDLNAMPDTVQTLAVVALFAHGATDIRNVANLRIKETDRIAALAAELTRLGATVETRPDGLRITPPSEVTPAAIATYDDHRMALSFALVGLVVPGLRICDAHVVTKSYPEFFEVLGGLGG
jgi:3-phosphoshikimate 1-carboxyvinyltransferase